MSDSPHPRFLTAGERHLFSEEGNLLALEFVMGLVQELVMQQTSSCLLLL